MAVAFGTSANTDVDASNPTLTLPSGVTADDLLLACIIGDVSTITVSAAPSGWTALTGTPSDAGDGDCRMWVYYKVAGASETNPQWTFTGNCSGVGTILRYTGVDTTAPINTQGKAGTASTTSHGTGSITPSVNDCMIVAFAGTDESSTVATWTPPTSWTERVDFADTHGESISLTAAEFLQGTAGSISGTFTSSLSDSGALHILALKPATGATAARPQQRRATAQAVSRAAVR